MAKFALSLAFLLVICGHQAIGFKVTAFYSGTWDLAHISYVGDCSRYFPTLQNELGMTYEHTNDWSKLNDNYLSTVDVVMFLDDQPWDQGQRSAFQRYMENGGGFIGYHVSAFTSDSNGWPWYHNTFLGSGNFYGNTWRPTSAVLKVEDPLHPAVARLPTTFTTTPNEWYSWSRDLSSNLNIKILLSIDPASFPLGTGPNPWEIWYDGYYPVVWTNTQYNMLYVNMGHNDMNYEDGSNAELSHTFESEIQNRFYVDALKWLGNKKARKESHGPLFKAFTA